MKIPKPLLSSSLGKLSEYESFLTILRYYVDLNCFVITPDPGDGGKGWMAVHYHRRTNSLFDFEKKYGFKFDWSKLTDPAFERSHPQGRPLLLESLGFFDIFTPIRFGKKRLGTVFSGAFSDREITADQLRDSWRRLTGQTASAESAEFRLFARVLLDTPVLENETLLAYRESLELFASVLAGNPPLRASQRLKELLTNVFSKQLPHSYWMDWALGLPTSQATPLWNLEVEQMEWVKTDIGITRIPTTVLTAVPLGEGRKRDPIEEMLRLYRFQRRAFRFAQSLPETVGGKLENYGSVFVTSADPSLGRLRRRRRILEIAEKIHRFAETEWGGAALVGVGETVAPGESLNESYRQSVLALHLQRGVGRPIVFFVPGRAEKTDGFAELTRLLLELKERFKDASFSNIEERLDAFLQQALTLSLHAPEEIRWHLHYAIVQVGETLKGRSDMDGAGITRMVEIFSSALEKSATTQEMVLSFKDSIEKLMGPAQRPGKTGEVDSVEKVREHLDRRFRAPVKIAKLAKLAGVSTSTLSRRFQKSTGVGLETYVQNLRIQEAKRLLKIGSLPVSQVAKACGFESASYFIRLFQKKNGISPGKFRKKSQPV